MDGGIRIGQVWNIPLRLHGSWFIIFGLVTWSLASGYFPQEFAGLSPTLYWVLGAITSLLFAASVLLHELGHSYLALKANMPVRSVTLFLFGGVAQLEEEARTPGDEFKVAIAGPVVSGALALLFWVLYQLDAALPFLAAPSAWLARINFSLAVFNLIPGYPLDGGRVLKSIIWKVSGNQRTAVTWASAAGQLVALGFIGVGVFTLFGGDFFNGLWLAFIGWFLQNAAAASYAQSSVQHFMKGVKVSQVMSTDPVVARSGETLSRLVDDHIVSGGASVFLITDSIGSGKLRGLLTLRHITAVPQENWATTTTGQVMVPLEQLAWIRPEIEMLEALRLMDDRNIAQVPVADTEGQIQGILCREQVVRYIRARAELGSAIRRSA